MTDEHDDEVLSFDEFVEGEPDDVDQATTDDGPSGLMTSMRDSAGQLLAILLAVLLVVPAGAWAIDVWVFSARGDRVAQAVPELADAVALVTRLGCDGTTGTGSGFAVSVDGRPAVITNRHVVRDASGVGLRTLSGTAGPDVVEVLLAPREDVAVLVLAEPLGSELTLGEPPRVGDEVRLVGFPGARPVTSAGTVADVRRARAVLDVEVDAGASGAPLVDADGDVVAQVVARTTDGRGVAILVDDLASAITEVEPAPGC